MGLQMFAVGLEQVVLDQSVYGGSFHKDFQEAEYELKYVSLLLCTYFTFVRCFFTYTGIYELNFKSVKRTFNALRIETRHTHIHIAYHYFLRR